MQRIAIAGSHGGFHLSDEAITRLAALGYDDPDRLPRDHPDLVSVVDELGPRAGAPERIVKGAPNRPIVVVDVPDGIDWVIDEYDGLEWVAERHRRWDGHGQLADGETVRPAEQGDGVRYLTEGAGAPITKAEADYFRDLPKGSLPEAGAKPEWAYDGRVTIRPLDRGIILDGGRDLEDVLANFLRGGGTSTGTEYAEVQITVTRRA